MFKLKNILSGTLTAALFGLIFVACTQLNAEAAKEQQCLALNIYHEARGEPVLGQIAVANVTLNRVADSRWPSTVCEVVYQPKQFSWTHMIEDHTPRKGDNWNIAQDIARGVLAGEDEDVTDGAVYYHADYVNPVWNRNLTITIVIGAHIFYKD